MTGREKIEAAFSEEGSPEIAAVVPYESILIRDHWRQLTDCPWWYSQSPDLEQHMAWRRDVMSRTGLDWTELPSCPPRDEREQFAIEERADGVFVVSRRTGQQRRLEEPRISGWADSAEPQSIHREHPADTFAEVDRLVPLPQPLDPKTYVSSGRADLAARILNDLGGVFPICHVSSPLWLCYGLWGFEGMMTMIASRPDLVEYACRRYLQWSIAGVHEAAVLGAAGVWIEECMTDMIGPDAFASLCAPFVRELVEAIREVGMKSIYYFCGNPAGKLDILLSTAADAISLEESKKGFSVDIEDVVDRVRGRCVVLGNLDAMRLLPHASEDELRAEISRQLRAGRKNGSRFIMSLGSPVTPETSVERVRLYSDLVHEMGV